MKVMVTGATGQLGSMIVEALLKTIPAYNLAVSVRDPQKAEGLKALGVEVRKGDFKQPETLRSTFAEIDRLLIVSSGDMEHRVEQHLAAIKAVQEANVGFIAYTSVVNASESSFILANDHRLTEEAIRNTRIPYSFLRNNWYVENETASIQAVLQGAPWLTSAGAGKVGWASRRDYAEAAASVLGGEDHHNTIYELSGKPRTQEEFATILAEVSGKEVAVQQVDDETYAKIMVGAGVPEALVPFLVTIQGGIREGALDIESNDFEILLGRPNTPLQEVIHQIVNKK